MWYVKNIKTKKIHSEHISRVEADKAWEALINEGKNGFVIGCEEESTIKTNQSGKWNADGVVLEN